MLILLFKNNMNVYILFGFDFIKDNLILNESDKLLYKKIYVIGNPADVDEENIEIIDTMNFIEFYKKMNCESSDENLVFIDCRGHTNIKTYLDIMYSLETSRFDKRSYYVKKSKDLVLNDYQLIQHFNPFEGMELPSNLSKVEVREIQSMYEVLTKVSIEYLKAGFYNYDGINIPKILNIPAGWMMNIYTLHIENFVRYYGLIPKIADVNRAMEFIHNAQYRYIVTDTLVRVVANYLVRNKIINSNDVDDWFDHKNWDLQKMNFYNK